MYEPMLPGRLDYRALVGKLILSSAQAAPQVTVGGVARAG
jgi:hypothetical protein